MELKPCNARNYKHGAYCRNMRLYSVWSAMIHRCEDPKREKYKDYGKRGISVCKEWHDPNTFMDWAFENGYSKGLQLDRVNNDGNYCPDNCRWVTPKDNSRNRRNAVFLSVQGETKSVAEWCELKPISPYTVYWWVREKGKAYAEQRLSEIA